MLLRSRIPTTNRCSLKVGKNNDYRSKAATAENASHNVNARKSYPCIKGAQHEFVIPKLFI